MRKNHDAKELIIDLRANSSGTLLGITNIAGLFIGRKTIAKLVSSRQKQLLKGSKSKVFYKPIKILIDAETASGTLMFAAALKYYTNAKLYGTRQLQKQLSWANQLLKLGPYQAQVKVAELHAPYLRGSNFKSLSPDYCISQHAGVYKVTSYTKSSCKSNIINFSSKRGKEPMKIINLLKSL